MHELALSNGHPPLPPTSSSSTSSSSSSSSSSSPSSSSSSSGHPKCLNFGPSNQSVDDGRDEQLSSEGSDDESEADLPDYTDASQYSQPVDVKQQDRAECAACAIKNAFISLGLPPPDVDMTVWYEDSWWIEEQLRLHNAPKNIFVLESYNFIFRLF